MSRGNGRFVTYDELMVTFEAPRNLDADQRLVLSKTIESIRAELPKLLVRPFDDNKLLRKQVKVSVD